MTTTVDVNVHDNIFFPEVPETKLGNNQKGILRRPTVSNGMLREFKNNGIG